MIAGPPYYRSRPTSGTWQRWQISDERCVYTILSWTETPLPDFRRI
jgi:hypothetical protein